MPPTALRLHRADRDHPGERIETAGRRLSLKNTFEYADGMRLVIPALPIWTAEDIRGRFEWVAQVKFGDFIDGAGTMRLGTMLEPIEMNVNGPTYKFRIQPRTKFLLGVKYAVFLEEHQDEFPQLAHLPDSLRIHFAGVPLVDAEGQWFVPYLRPEGGRVTLDFKRIKIGFFESDRVAHMTRAA